MFSKERADGPTGHWRQYLSVGAILLAGIALTVASFLLFTSLERDRSQREFRERASAHATALGRTVDRSIEVVDSIRALFDASVEVERHEFAAFTRSALADSPQIQALEWLPRVPGEEMTAYIKAARADGLHGFQVMELDPGGRLVVAGNRPEYFPVFYVEPMRGNKVALGFDLGSETVRRQALELARDTGKPAMTGPLRIVQEPESQMSFLLFVPVYQKFQPLDSLEQRRQHLLGFALGVFRVNEMVAASFRNRPPANINLWLYDVTGPSGPVFMYSSGPDMRGGGG